MGRQKVRKEVGTSIRENVKQGVSRLANKVKGDSMSDKGWKAITIVGMWASVAVMFAATGEVNENVVSGIATASVLLAFLL